MCCAEAGDTISTDNAAAVPRSWILVILSSPHYRPIDMGRRRTRPASPRQHSRHRPNRRSRFGDPDLTERTANLRGAERWVPHSSTAHQKEGPDRASKTRTGDAQAAFPCHGSDVLAMREKS